MIKALLLNVADAGGGASRAAYRLHQSFKNTEIDSRLLVQNRQTDDPGVFTFQTKIEKGLNRFRPLVNALPLNLLTQANSNTYSLQWLPERVASSVNKFEPEIVNFHWICDGFLRIETIPKFSTPLVWTLHDMWPLTGGCHYSGECQRYLDSCGLCPQLGSAQLSDFSSWVWQRKKKAFKDLNLTLVTPSHWLASCAKSSSLFAENRVEVIPYGLDLQIYKPIEASLARNILNLPQDKQLILFGAIQATSDFRKGFHLLQPALQYLRNCINPDNTQIVIMGASRPVESVELGFRTHYLGTLRDDYSLVLAYSAADIFVAPSLQDNLPNTILESIACGTPCVAFNIGGMPDLINHKQNGYLAHPFEIKDFADGMNLILGDVGLRKRMSAFSRKKAEQEFHSELQAERYRDLFYELVDSSPRKLNS